MDSFKIYTKTGDSGETSLVGGLRVSKSHPKVCAYGKADELISLVALLRCKLPSWQEVDSNLRKVEVALMKLSARIASLNSSKVCGVCASDVAFLEQQIDSIQAQLPEAHAFVLPGRPEASALCHVARTVCREVERLMVESERVAVEGLVAADGTDAHFETMNRVQFEYINRLSDYLFVLARFICVKSGNAEDFWLP